MNPHHPDSLLPSLNEDLSYDPLQEEIRDKLRDLVGRGFDAAVIAETGLIVSSALMLDTDGLRKTAFRLVAAGHALAHAPPEVRGERSDERH